MSQKFDQLKNRILKNAEKSARYFDKILLEGDSLQNIYLKILEFQKHRGSKRYERKGEFIKDGTFWGHIGARIRKEKFVICIDGSEILQLSKNIPELTDYFDRNVFIKLIGCGDDIVADCLEIEQSQSSTAYSRKNTVEDQLLEDLYSQVQKSISDSPEARKKRLSKAKKIPKKIEVCTVTFLRNPDVIAEALLKANGICDFCKEPAPFKRRSDASPYLEVHHKKPLSQGGEDTLENAVALCPNCHKREHYG